MSEDRYCRCTAVNKTSGIYYGMEVSEYKHLYFRKKIYSIYVNYISKITKKVEFYSFPKLMVMGATSVTSAFVTTKLEEHTRITVMMYGMMNAGVPLKFHLDMALPRSCSILGIMYNKNMEHVFFDTNPVDAKETYITVRKCSKDTLVMQDKIDALFIFSIHYDNHGAKSYCEPIPASTNYNPCDPNTLLHQLSDITDETTLENFVNAINSTFVSR
jgi:hypothetical protein